ncbi:helix-hairpin-helix domain-containing protein [Nocardia sp. NPDC051030]|uniref:ComEA family DNA-binding protein n=1 Tax=Nocardia sp. NPDC051030 TaxID=3155162 RepID=UPI00341E06BC
MPRIDERAEVRRRLDARNDPEAPTARTDFAPSPPHPPRWDEESIDPPTPERDKNDGRERAGSPTPAWLSEPCGSVSLWHERLVPERFRGTRWDPGPRGVLVLAAVGVAAVILAGLVSFRERPVAQAVPPITSAAIAEIAVADPADPEAPPTSQATAPAVGAPTTSRTPLTTTATGATGSASPAAELVISVIGLVEHGGIRRFPPGARIADALRAATPRPEADLSGLNLAQHLCDGDQIIIGRTNPRPGPQQVGSTIINSARGATADNTAPTGAARTSGTPVRINLNTATEAELDGLPGVGPITARAILAWRTRHGRFTSVDQLTEIDGIGPSRLAKLRAVVTI